LTLRPELPIQRISRHRISPILTGIRLGLVSCILCLASSVPSLLLTGISLIVIDLILELTALLQSYLTKLHFPLDLALEQAIL